MKTRLIYSLMVAFAAFFFNSCSEQEEVSPIVTSQTLSSGTGTVDVGGFPLGCIRQDRDRWSFTIGAGARHGLSNLQLELLRCPDGRTIRLGAGSITSAYIIVNGNRYNLTPIYNSDGSCRDIKEDDFTSFVKFEFNGGLDDLVKQYGGTLYFTLADGSIVLYGANVIIKSGGPRDQQCSRGQILNCDRCDRPEPPRRVCSYSQGRYFNAGRGGADWDEVTVGGLTFQKGDYELPATTPQERALLQAATLILSAEEQNIPLATYIASLPQGVQAAYNCIVDYYTDGTPNCDLQQAAGTIGDWIDRNHCEDRR